MNKISLDEQNPSYLIKELHVAIQKCKNENNHTELLTAEIGIAGIFEMAWGKEGEISQLSTISCLPPWFSEDHSSIWH